MLHRIGDKSFESDGPHLAGYKHLLEGRLGAFKQRKIFF